MRLKYYKHSAESELGDGIVFMEAKDDSIVRQVEVYGTTMIWCDEESQSDDRFMLADLPVSKLGLGVENEISVDEFNEVWLKAKLLCQ